MDKYKEGIQISIVFSNRRKNLVIMLKTTDEIHFVDFKFIITELKLKKDTNTLRIAKLN